MIITPEAGAADFKYLVSKNIVFKRFFLISRFLLDLKLKKKLNLHLLFLLRINKFNEFELRSSEYIELQACARTLSYHNCRI